MEALKTYTVLTVGDGLVTMIPSLLVSVAGGMVVTRASSDSTLSDRFGQAVVRQQPPVVDCSRGDDRPRPDSGTAQALFHSHGRHHGGAGAPR